MNERDPRMNPVAGDRVDGYRVIRANRQFVTYSDGQFTVRTPIRGWRNLVAPAFTKSSKDTP